MIDLLPDQAGRISLECTHCRRANRVPWSVSMMIVLAAAIVAMLACGALALLLASPLVLFVAPVLWWLAFVGGLQQYLVRSNEPFARP